MGESGCACVVRVWRSGKQVDSVSSSVGVGGAVGGAFGEEKVLVGSVISVVSVLVLWVLPMSGVSASSFAGVEGWRDCST